MFSMASVHDAPIALLSDGSVAANLTHLARETDPHELLDAALRVGRPVFVGVVLDQREVREALTRLDDAAAEIVAVVVAPKP